MPVYYAHPCCSARPGLPSRSVPWTPVAAEGISSPQPNSNPMKHFTLGELTRSQTARMLGLDNTPGAVHRRNLEELTLRLLDPLREAWEARCCAGGLGPAGVRVTSGYRSRALNQAVGGAPTSAHLYGYAADLVPVNGCLAAFRDCCAEFLRVRPFDQMISEQEDARGVPRWVHVGYRDGGGRQRRQLLAQRGGTCYPLGR